MPRRKKTNTLESKMPKTNEDSYVYMSFSRKARKSWKPLRPTTVNFVTNLMKHTSKKILEDIPNVSLLQRRAFSQLLENLTKEVEEELATVTAPPSKLNYNEFEEQVMLQSHELGIQEIKDATETMEEKFEQLQLNKSNCEKELKQRKLATSRRNT